MSQKAVEQIVDKMTLDIEFHKLMASDIDNALADYGLTGDERMSKLWGDASVDRWVVTATLR